MKNMACRAGIRDAATRAVAGRTSLARRKQNVRRVLAVNGIMALRAGKIRVFRVIELRLRQPAFLNHRLRDFRRT